MTRLFCLSFVGAILTFNQNLLCAGIDSTERVADLDSTAKLETCVLMLQTENFRNFMLSGADAAQVYRAFQKTNAGEFSNEKTFSAGTDDNGNYAIFGYTFDDIVLLREMRNGDERFFINFEDASRTQIDQFLMLFDELPPQDREFLDGNDVFDVYKVAGLQFDNSEAAIIANTLFQVHRRYPFLISQTSEPTVKVYSIGRITLTLLENAGAKIEFQFSMVDASREEAQAFIYNITHSDSDLLEGYPPVPEDIFQNTRKYGLNVLQRARAN